MMVAMPCLSANRADTRRQAGTEPFVAGDTRLALPELPARSLVPPYVPAKRQGRRVREPVENPGRPHVVDARSAISAMVAVIPTARAISRPRHDLFCAIVGPWRTPTGATLAGAGSSKRAPAHDGIHDRVHSAEVRARGPRR